MYLGMRFYAASAAVMIITGLIAAAPPTLTAERADAATGSGVQVPCANPVKLPVLKLPIVSECDYPDGSVSLTNTSKSMVVLVRTLGNVTADKVAPATPVGNVSTPANLLEQWLDSRWEFPPNTMVDNVPTTKTARITPEGSVTIQSHKFRVFLDTRATAKYLAGRVVTTLVGNNLTTVAVQKITGSNVKPVKVITCINYMRNNYPWLSVTGNYQHAPSGDLGSLKSDFTDFGNQIHSFINDASGISNCQQALKSLTSEATKGEPASSGFNKIWKEVTDWFHNALEKGKRYFEDFTTEVGLTDQAGEPIE
jgi:hypothetical protein